MARFFLARIYSSRVVPPMNLRRSSTNLRYLCSNKRSCCACLTEKKRFAHSEEPLVSNMVRNSKGLLLIGQLLTTTATTYHHSPLFIHWGWANIPDRRVLLGKRNLQHHLSIEVVGGSGQIFVVARAMDRQERWMDTNKGQEISVREEGSPESRSLPQKKSTYGRAAVCSLVDCVRIAYIRTSWVPNLQLT